MPQIGVNRGKNLMLMDTTPDTQGQPVRRFQEIVESDDETNGNGSRVQRQIKARKF